MAKPSDTYSQSETKVRFEAIIRGAIHKPTKLKDIPKKRERKPAKASASRASSRASG
jgi:hypothetical protein